MGKVKTLIEECPMCGVEILAGTCPACEVPIPVETCPGCGHSEFSDGYGGNECPECGATMEVAA